MPRLRGNEGFLPSFQRRTGGKLSIEPGGLIWCGGIYTVYGAGLLQKAYGEEQGKRDSDTILLVWNRGGSAASVAGKNHPHCLRIGKDVIRVM